jgi:hypothetical protein
MLYVLQWIQMNGVHLLHHSYINFRHKNTTASKIKTERQQTTQQSSPQKINNSLEFENFDCSPMSMAV